MVSTNDFAVSLEEMKNFLTLQFSGITAIKNTARVILGTTSVIIAMIGTLQIFRPVPDDVIRVYLLLIILVIILYLILIILCVLVLSPLDLHGPIDPSWDTLKKYIIGQHGEELVKIQISAYLNAISLNDKILNKRKNQMLIASIILPIIVIFLIILGSLPLYKEIISNF